jgi:hypothetical protein
MAHIGTEVKDKVVPHTAGRTPVNAYHPCASGYSSVAPPAKTSTAVCSTPISAMMCDWSDGPRSSSTSWCPRCPWRDGVSAGASAPPVSITGSRLVCGAASPGGSMGIVAVADRSGPPGRSHAWWSGARPVHSAGAARRPGGPPCSSGCCSGGSAAGATTASRGVRGCTIGGLRFTRPAWWRLIWMRPSAWRGCRRQGRRWDGRPNGAKG